jgi:hypothetical protein
MSSEMSRRYLERGQDANIEAAQGRERYIIERELCLPNRQQNVDHVGETVVQGVGEAGEQKSAPGSGPSRHLGTIRWDDC